MDWFRKHIRHGARLALLALAVQFAMSFSHVHAAAPNPTAFDTRALTSETVSASPSYSELITASIDAEYGASNLAAVSDQPDHPPARTSHDDCAICAVMALAGTVLFAQPPVLLLPDAIGFLYRTTDAGLVHLDPTRTAFQPRGPPAT